jgi:Protein of unknown function (DUF3995)
VTSTPKHPRARSHGASSGLTAAVLVAIAGLHALWGFGSSFPFRTREELADSVVGSSDVPSRRACVSVAAALVLSAILVARMVPLPTALRKVALRVVTTVLATRGVAGAMGRTSTLSPGSDSPAFNRLDKRLYSPLCLWLAASVQRSI